ncbi:MAG: preprotein translocase subunit SecG [Pyrinomonadaceae bacterium]
MVYFLYTLFFLSCVVLVASVLLQPGKTDAGALFTSNISSTAFQPRGATTILSKITIIAATIFMLSALFLAMPALTGNISVLQTTSENPAEVTPVIDANANTAVDANANTAVDANANQANANLPANAAVVTNTNPAGNMTVNTANTNAAANNTANANTPKIDEPKPPQKESPKK